MAQPCAICTGPTERLGLRVAQVLEASNWCPRCRVYTADADGQETERWARFNAQRVAVAVAALRRQAGLPA